MPNSHSNKWCIIRRIMKAGLYKKLESKHRQSYWKVKPTANAKSSGRRFLRILGTKCFNEAGQSSWKKLENSLPPVPKFICRGMSASPKAPIKTLIDEMEFSLPKMRWSD
jgi:hypothetical protein